MKLKRRPFMTLIVSVAGKFYDEIEMSPEKPDSILYQVNEDDPNILSMKIDYEVGQIQSIIDE